jgi:hypothetical protein
VGPDPRSEIENVLYRYAWAYDMDEVDGMAGCYTADAEVEFMDVGVKVGRGAVVEEMRRRRVLHREKDVVPWHVISNVLIERLGVAEARVISFWTFVPRTPDGSLQIRAIGYYDDVFMLEDGHWRIHRRRVRMAGE